MSTYSYFIVRTPSGAEEGFDFAQAQAIAQQHDTEVIAVRLDGSQVTLNAAGDEIEEMPADH